MDCERRELLCSKEIVCRTLLQRPPSSLYSKGNVGDVELAIRYIHMLQGHFLQSQSRGRPTGTIFIIHSVTGRPIKRVFA